VNATNWFPEKPEIVKDNPSIAKAAADVGKPGKLICLASAVPEANFGWIRESDGADMNLVPSVKIDTKPLSPTESQVAIDFCYMFVLVLLCFSY